MSTADTAAGVAAYIAALGLTAVASLALAVFILARARQLPGGPLLAVLLAGVAVWSVAQALPVLIGPAATPLVTTLIALSPLPAAAFVHLAFAYALHGMLRLAAAAGYAAGLAAALAGLLFGVGDVVPWRGFPGMFVPSAVGWGVLGVAALLSVAGHLRLARIWWQGSGARGRQAGAVFVSSAIGIFALTGFGFPALGIDAYPWPVLALPFYSVALVYGILRHRFMAVNLWARRALAWLMLVALAGLVSAGIASLPLAFLGRPAGLLSAWAAMTGALAFGVVLLVPLKRVADRLVFPGGQVGEADVERWRGALAGPDDEAALEERARTLLAQRLGIAADEGAPTIRIVGDAAQLEGWDDAPPATRHVAERFAGLASEAAHRIASARRLVEAERGRQQQARLAELGELAASVAHDLRNPLGIVRMAATAAPAEARREIGTQVERMDRLVTDILDYAKAWSVSPQPLRLAELAAQAGVEAEVPEGLTISADRRAMARVLANLIDNARAMGGRVALFAEAGPPATLDVCDDGPGVPPEIADDLFRPFVSRRPGGTGLGLAIVRRIMEAHGGQVALAERSGWPTCFRLTFGNAR